MNYAATLPFWPLQWLDFAWMACGIYFLASIWRTNKIKQRESHPLRVLDKSLIYGGYVALFYLGPRRSHSAWAAAWKHMIFPPHVALELFGMAIGLAGLALTCWSRACLGRYWSGVVALKQDHQLIRSGPYCIVRHPLYSGLILAAIGTALAEDVWHALLGIALITACFLRRAGKEDALLAAEFGATFAEYRERTGQIIPGVG